MPKQWIAILGSMDEKRADIDPPFRNLDKAVEILHHIGEALAENECGMIVYSSDAAFIEPHVVAGYIASGKAANDSIRVIYSRFCRGTKQSVDQIEPTFIGDLTTIMAWKTARIDQWRSHATQKIHYNPPDWAQTLFPHTGI
jgi:hypothetical protein